MNRWKTLWKQYRNVLLTSAAIVVGAIALTWTVVAWLSQPAPEPKRVVQEISLVRPPPPPPEPEEPPPPPPEIEEEIDLPEPEPMQETVQSDEPPPGPLGLDADGTAGADGFGLMARRGGRDILASVGDRFGWYAGLLQRDILDHLSDVERLRSRGYDVNVRLWLDTSGAVRNIEMVSGSGDPEIDRLISQTLTSIASVEEPPPADLPQPVLLRVRSRL